MSSGKPFRPAIWLIIALLFSCSVLAQDTDETDSTAPAAVAPGSEPSKETTPDPNSGDTERSPFEYKSSEEISEDSSVSFPVDI